MQTTEVKILPKSEVLLTIEIPEGVLQEYEDTAAKVVSQRVDVPGFRKGSAPKAFIMAQIGADAFFSEVLSVALPKSYFAAIKEKNLQVVSRPEIKVISKSPLKYEAKVGILPEIKFKDYEKIRIDAEPVKIEEKEILEVVDEMRRYRATYKSLDREVRKGDRVEINFQGFDDGGAPIDRTQSKNHPLFVGEGNLVEGFEENLVGMKVGEKKKFPVKFPKTYHYDPLKEKTVYFEVEVKKGEEAILPDLNDSFVEQIMGEKKTVPEFKEALRADIHRRKEAENRQARENKLLERFLKDAELEVPPVLINEEIEYMMEDLAKDLEKRKLSFADYLKQIKKKEEDLKKQFEPEAEKRVKVRLILNFLFREMKVEVSEEELAEAKNLLVNQYPDNERQKVEAEFKARGNLYLRLKNNLMLEKVFKKFLD